MSEPTHSVPPEFSIVFITRDRHEELVDIITKVSTFAPTGSEIILVDNDSQPEIKARNAEALREIPSLSIIENDQNLGVSGGRNCGLKAATGKYVIELDDDAVLEDEVLFDRVRAEFEAQPETGVLAFRIVNFFSRTIQRQEFPFKDKQRDSLQPGESPTFIGCGHAFRQAVLQEIGVYRDFSPWGSEEADYALRVIDRGYRIQYVPSITVFHKKSPKARISDPVEFGSIALKNRLKMALLNLPWFAVITYFAVRVPHFVIKTRSLRVVWLMQAKLRTDWPYIKNHRQRISNQAFWRVSKLGGQAWF